METAIVYLVKCVLKESVSLAVALIQIVKQMKYAYTTSEGNFVGSSNKSLLQCYHILTLLLLFSIYNRKHDFKTMS
jgi:hypothetical protein